MRRLMGIQDKINQILLKEQEERSKRQKSGKWSPSMMGRCYRAQYWNRKAEPPTDPPDSRALRIFRCGKIFHDFVQNLIPDHTEVKVETDDILGFADIVTKDMVIDIKSAHSKSFHYMEKESFDIKTDKFNNWLQVGCYSSILKKKWCGLMFVSKDDLCIKEYYIPTQKLTDFVLDELTQLRKFWEEDKLPPVDPRAYGGKEKKYCSYRSKCGDECK